MKRGRGTCSMFQSYKLMYLHVLRAGMVYLWTLFHHPQIYYLFLQRPFHFRVYLIVLLVPFYCVDGSNLFCILYFKMLQMEGGIIMSYKHNPLFHWGLCLYHMVRQKGEGFLKRRFFLDFIYECSLLLLFGIKHLTIYRQKKYIYWYLMMTNTNKIKFLVFPMQAKPVRR